MDDLNRGDNDQLIHSTRCTFINVGGLIKKTAPEKFSYWSHRQVPNINNESHCGCSCKGSLENKCLRLRSEKVS